jgi:hypothetical protein
MQPRGKHPRWKFWLAKVFGERVHIGGVTVCVWNGAFYITKVDKERKPG